MSRKLNKKKKKEMEDDNNESTLSVVLNKRSEKKPTYSKAHIQNTHEIIRRKMNIMSNCIGDD